MNEETIKSHVACSDDMLHDITIYCQWHWYDIVKIVHYVEYTFIFRDSIPDFDDQVKTIIREFLGNSTEFECKI